MKKTVIVIVLFIFALCALQLTPAAGCTVAVVSGKATPDGRPLLWKNRDSGNEANKVMFFEGGKYKFIGVVNADDDDGEEVWAGTNSAGFCIMNAASYNVNQEAKEKDGDKRRMDEEGTFMKLALGGCGTVDDFQKLLDDTKNDRGVEANFGVIDAHGGAAFFETDNDGYVRFDADDPKVAPEGYIVRTNFSYSGKPNDGAGYIRFDRMSKLFHDAVTSTASTRTGCCFLLRATWSTASPASTHWHRHPRLTRETAGFSTWPTASPATPPVPPSSSRVCCPRRTPAGRSCGPAWDTRSAP